MNVGASIPYTYNSSAEQASLRMKVIKKAALAKDNFRDKCIDENRRKEHDLVAKRINYTLNSHLNEKVKTSAADWFVICEFLGLGCTMLCILFVKWRNFREGLL